MFEEDSRPVNSLASLSPPFPASSDLRKGPEGLWKQALFMLRGMLRRSVSPDVPNRISSKFHDVAARHRQESRAPNFLPISSSDPRLNHRFFLSVTYSPYFLPPFLVPAIGIVEKGIGEKNFQRYFAPTIDANSRTRDRP